MATIGGVSDQKLQAKFEQQREKDSEYNLLSRFGVFTDAEYAKRSPVKWADEINTPLLIMHGEKDGLVDPKNAHILATRLKELKKTFKLYICKAAGHHCMQDKSNRNEITEIMKLIHNWFSKYPKKQF